MQRVTPLIVFALLALLVGLGCMERNYFSSRFQQTRKAELIIDGVESGPDNPVLLCGEDDLTQFISILVCANGEKVYKTLVAGLDQEDLTFNGSTDKGYSVHKFKAVCYMKEYEFYITIDACDEVRQYN
jgi:hypothetical protein